MALHDDLLRQAKHLVGKEPKHPNQASLRRAVSAAYYALFHAMIAEAATVLAPPKPADLRARVGRTFIHTDMKKVCLTFSQGQLQSSTAKLISGSLRPEIIFVARIFVELQDARHTADYDTLEVFSKADVVAKIAQAEQSLENLKLIRGEPNSNVFFAALLLQPRWGR